ncbi:MAG: MogA/MoaB family molybdenum cofactor biosynthesis protein [Gemmatimonadota bacterium]
MAHHPRRAAVVTVSDRVVAGTAQDQSGPRLAQLLIDAGWIVAATEVTSDDADAIAGVLTRLADQGGIALVLTTGGTGLGPRDVTPDGTRRIAEREVPGIAEALRSFSIERTPHAMLSRATAAIRGRTLIINLPGSPRAVSQTFDVLAPVLDHAVSLVAGGTPTPDEHRAVDHG